MCVWEADVLTHYIAEDFANRNGHVTTGLQIIGEVDGDDWMVSRPLQKYISGNWYNVEQAQPSGEYMQHLKNITAGNPKTIEQYQLTKKLALSGYIQKTVKTGMTN